jgi:hypothetical protein
MSKSKGLTYNKKTNYAHFKSIYLPNLLIYLTMYVLSLTYLPRLTYVPTYLYE